MALSSSDSSKSGVSNVVDLLFHLQPTHNATVAAALADLTILQILSISFAILCVESILEQHTMN